MVSGLSGRLKRGACRQLSQQAQKTLSSWGQRAPDFGTQSRGCLTWAASGQGSWQCSMRGTQALFTSPLKKCFLETLTILASLLNRRKAFKRSSSLSCGQDRQSSSETQGTRSPTKRQPFSMDPFGCLDPCETFWIIPLGWSVSSRAQPIDPLAPSETCCPFCSPGGAPAQPPPKAWAQRGCRLDSRCQRRTCTARRWHQRRTLRPLPGARPGSWPGPPCLQRVRWCCGHPSGSIGTSPGAACGTASPGG